MRTNTPHLIISCNQWLALHSACPQSAANGVQGNGNASPDVAAANVQRGKRGEGSTITRQGRRGGESVGEGGDQRESLPEGAGTEGQAARRHAPMTGSAPVHLMARPSYLSSERMWHEKHTGLVNLLVGVGCCWCRNGEHTGWINLP